MKKFCLIAIVALMFVSCATTTNTTKKYREITEATSCSYSYELNVGYTMEELAEEYHVVITGFKSKAHPGAKFHFLKKGTKLFVTNAIIVVKCKGEPTRFMTWGEPPINWTVAPDFNWKLQQAKLRGEI